MIPEYLRFIRVRGNKLQVYSLSWRGPHTIVDKWVTVKTLSRSLNSLDVEAIQSFDFGEPVALYVEEPIVDNFENNEAVNDVTIEPLDMDAIINRLLKNKKYFGFCDECKQYNIEGHMHSDHICHSCAEEKFDFVH